MGKTPFFFLSPATKTGEGVRTAPAAWAGGPGGSAAALGRGKRERGPRGTYSPPRFGPGRSEEVGPRRRAASSRGDRGGGAAGWEGGQAVAEVVVGVEGCEERLFIGGIRWWRGGAAVLGRRGSRPALMAVGASAVSWSSGARAARQAQVDKTYRAARRRCCAG